MFWLGFVLGVLTAAGAMGMLALAFVIEDRRLKRPPPGWRKDWR